MPAPVEDAVELRLGGDVVTIYEDYEVDRSILRQPAAFSARLGWGKAARELREKYPPKTPFELRAGGLLIMAGVIDAPKLSGPPTTLMLSGRDAIAPLFDSDIEDEQSFSDTSFLDLTLKALDAVGLGEITVIADNTANRKAQSGSRTTKKKLETVTTLNPATGLPEESLQESTVKVAPPSLKAEIGQTWFEFLQRQYHRAGLFLIAAPEGYLVLMRPNGVQAPSATLVHRRTGDRSANNVLAYDWSDDRTNRHARAAVYGRAGGGKHGRKKVVGEFVDEEMSTDGYVNQCAIKDEHVRTNTEAQYAARRRIAEERRAGWRLEYTVAGHTTFDGAGNRVLWTPDTTVQIEDEELGLRGKFYLEGVTFRRGPETTTRLQFMRVADLVFAEKLF